MPNSEFTETEKKRAMMFFTTLLDRSLVGNGVNPFQDLDWDSTVEKGIEALLKMKQKDSFKFFSEKK